MSPWPGSPSSSCSSATAQVGTGPSVPGWACSQSETPVAQLPNPMCAVPSLPSAVSVFAGSLSQPVVTQPASLSASLGATARLTCTLSRDINVGSYNIYWFQQMAGSPPRYLLYYYSDSSTQLGPGVPSRFSGSKDASANAGLLLISGLQPEDEADYYCAIWHSSAGRSDTDIWGSGTNTQPAYTTVV